MTGPVLLPRSDADSSWRAAYAVGRRAHAGVDLSFAGFLSRSVGAPIPHVPADYYLARACDLGVEGSWERLQHELRRPLLAFLSRRGASRPDADAVMDDAWGTLAAPPPSGGASTALGTYDGRGPLHAWVATVVWRRLCDRWKARAAAPPPGPEPDTVPGTDDPAQRIADAETARALGDALEEAWPRLTPKELEAVVLRYRHELPQTAIAQAMRVGTPRVTRLLQSAARRLRAAVEARLGDTPSYGGSGDAWTDARAAVERLLARARTDLDPPASLRSTIDG